MTYEITTKIARCQIGEDIWQSGDDILTDSITIHLGEDKAASTCSFSVYDPGFLIAAKYRKISIKEGGIVVDQELLGKGVQQETTPDHVQNTSIGTPTASPQVSSSNDGGNGIVSSGDAFTPQVKAFADLIAWKEVPIPLGIQGYYANNGVGSNTGYFTDADIRAGGGFPASAGNKFNIGRYQFNKSDWVEAKASNPNIKSYSPQDQDLVLLYKLQYRGVLKSLQNGNLPDAIHNGGKEWASLPGSPYGQVQSGYTVTQAIDYYNKRLAYYQSQAGTAIAPTTPQVDGVKLNQIAATMQPAKPDSKQLKTTPPPTEDTQKGREIIVSMMVGTSDFKALIDFHYIHVGTDSSKQLGKEITTFSGKSVRFFLSRVPQTVTHSNITLKQFADKVCKQYGLKLVMDGDGLEYHYLPQHGQTPFQVLERECRKIGFKITDNPRTMEITIEPYARPQFTGFSVDEETLIEAKFSDKAAATPRYIPGAIASMDETQGSASKTSIDRASGSLSQSQADNKVGAGSQNGVTGVQSPAAGGISKVFCVTLNKLAAQQQATNKTAIAPQTVITSDPVTTTKTITKADGSIITIGTVAQTVKQYLQITQTVTTTTKTVKGSNTSTVVTKVTNVFTDKGTTTTTATTQNGATTTTTQTSTKVNNAVLATKTIPQAGGVAAASATSGNTDDATGLAKVTPGEIALEKDGMVKGDALTNEKARIKLYEGSLTLRTTEEVLQLIPGQIIGLSGRFFPPELATEIRISDINHDFASGKSMISFYTPGMAQTDTSPSVPNTSINQQSNTPAPPVPPSSGGLILPMQPLQKVGDGVGFIPSRGRVHKGVDIVAPQGTPVVASGDGLVVDTVTGCTVGDFECGGRWGNQVILALKVPSTGETIYHRYAHLKPGSITVQKGQTVKQGQQVAQCGTTGHSSGPHLHFENRRGDPFGDYFPPSTFGIACPPAQAGKV